MDMPPDPPLPVPAALASSGKRGLKLSELLTQIAADHPHERISIADIMARMDDRAYGALMFIFAVPNLLPTPPGTSLILGMPLLFLAAQLTIGLRVPLLPRIIGDRSLLLSDFAAIITRIAPLMARAERLMRPRLILLATRPLDQVIGAACAILALVLFLPIPLGNMLPALAICLFSLALLERDGVVSLLGWLTAIVSIAVVSGVVYAMVRSAIFLLSDVLGLVSPN